MTIQVLVTAASRHGATHEIARAISEELQAAGFETALLPPDAVPSLEAYDAVILGSAVYAGRWLEPARRFAEHYRAALLDRPVWLFSSGPIGGQPAKEEEALDVAGIRETTRARDHRVFAGKLDHRELGLAERAIVRVVRAPEGDFRPWDEIAAWARGIAAALDAPIVATAAVPA
jgi:menaquinone-dependent protoporphyrinogen oxidase